MQFVSRIFLVTGAILASIHQPSRPDLRGPASYQGVHQTLGSLRGAVSSSSPTFKVVAFGTVSRLVRSKGHVSRRGSLSNSPTPPPPSSNFPIPIIDQPIHYESDL
ncbi:unnamed protein product [Rhizoctonia solani]|uniref:Uncharacterized protein n=1 Tax=Rhizoctonia solani TaxID=456999 RepID=A0A8H3CZ83_9AGAM|nr:unnamed protein product [Rhizoctonia solani]